LHSLEQRFAPAITVTNLDDSGFGSLRAAVSTANTAPGADTIDFQAGLKGEITLTTGELAITDTLTVNGPGSQVIVVRGNNASRIFAAQTPLTVAGLTLSNGKAEFGGAIYAGTALVLTDCILFSNSASASGGAIGIGTGSLTATGCSFLNNTAVLAGGAIAVIGQELGPISTGGSATLTGCTVSGNSANEGGGLFVRDKLTIANSSVSGNTATAGPGGGVRVAGLLNGFPIQSSGPASLSLVNSTISGNVASGDGGGIAIGIPAQGTGNEPSYLEMANCTITNCSAGGQGGGIAAINIHPITLDSSIVAQNISTAGGTDFAFDLLTDVTGSKNIIGVANVGNLNLIGTGNQSGTSAAPFNAKLSKLGDFGGLLAAHHPLRGSPAIDAGYNPLTLATDQRGQPRVFNGKADIGAFEINPASFVVNLTNDELDGDYGPADRSLREAVELVSASKASTDTITFSSVFDKSRTILLTLGELLVQGGVEILGPTAATLTINGNNAGRIFNFGYVVPNPPARLSRLRMVFGHTGLAGGAIQAGDMNLTLDQCTISDSSADLLGGAVAMTYGGRLVANDCTISSNSSNGAAGALFATGPVQTTIQLTRCTVSGNTAPTGGAIYMRGYLFVDGSTLSGNSASAGIGGAIRFWPSSAVATGLIRNSTLSGNSATTDGGGLAVQNMAGSLIIQNTTVTANSAGGNGGGIAITGGKGNHQLTSTIVAGNTSVSGTPDFFYNGGATVSGDRNLIGVADKGGATLTGMNNQTGTLMVPLDAKLGPLVHNGGPTLTHALLVNSPALDKGSNPPPALAVDQRGAGFPRELPAGLPDVGAFEAPASTPPPTVAVVVNDGSAQRSLVTRLTATFSDNVNFPLGLAAAFSVQRTGPGLPTGNVTLAVLQVDNVVTVTFTDPTYAPGAAKSLIDGLYTFTLVAANIQGAGGLLDADGNGIGGDNLVVNTHRLFGDADGDRDVDAQDFGAFRGAFGGTTNLAFDSDGDGDVDAADFGQFRARFGSSV